MAKKNILEEAMEDAKLLKETAIENAKNVLVEAISPKIKEFVDSQLGESGMYEEPEAPMMGAVQESDEDDDGADDAMDVDAGDDDGSDMGMDDGGMEMGDGAMGGHADEQSDLEMLAKLLKKFGLDTEKMAGGLGEAKKDDADCSDEDMMKEGEDDKVDEVVEITNEDLKSALSEVLGSMKLKNEATVTKGFGAVQDPTPKNAGGKAETGLADMKNGEAQWSDETPPDSQDWTVKEAVYRKKLAVYENAVKLLKTENSEYKQACNLLKRNLQEVNLFNSKLLYTNKLLHSAKLNNEQRLSIIETFDRAQTMREVELVYKSLSESMKIAGVLGESKQPQRSSMKGPKGSRFAAPGSSVINESADRDGSDNFAQRMQALAGLVD